MSAANRIEEQAAAWIALRDSDRWDEKLQCELDGWLAESTLQRVTFLRLADAWERADRLKALRKTPATHAASWYWLRGSWFAPWAPRAAVAGALLAGAIFAAVVAPWSWRPGAPQTTALGERKTISLTDGSRVTLNTATRLRTAIGGDRRRVWLDEGEAYFDVARDPSRPFEVQAGDERVVVLGTKFTVRRNGDRVRVAVLEGRVQVLSASAAALTLLPGQTATADGAAPTVATQTTRQTSSALSWLEGKLVFDRVSLADAATELNRYNRKQLVMGDAGAARLVIGGTFGATQVEAFARLLHDSFGLDVAERDDTIVVRSPTARN